MKFRINKNLISNVKMEVRRSGYALIYDRRRGVESFVRRLGSGHYPRFHLYINDDGRNLIFNLHLDQKKASYAGYNMHNAEYDDSLVEDEVNRLKSFFGVLGDDRALGDFNYNKMSEESLVDGPGIINRDEVNSDYKNSSNSLSGNLEDDLSRLNIEHKKKRKFLFFKV